jgi:hypothetical protein
MERRGEAGFFSSVRNPPVDEKTAGKMLFVPQNKPALPNRYGMCLRVENLFRSFSILMCDERILT